MIMVALDLTLTQMIGQTKMLFIGKILKPFLGIADMKFSMSGKCFSLVSGSTQHDEIFYKGFGLNSD